MSKDDYESAVNLALWAEIKAQFKPHNPNGKESSKALTPVKHQIAAGEVRKEFLQGQQKARIDFQRERAEEEKQNLNFLNPENPEIEGEMRRELSLAEQQRIEREIERSKTEKEREEADAALALKLQQEEERKREEAERKREREEADRQFAKQLAKQMEAEEGTGKGTGKPTTSKCSPKNLCKDGVQLINDELRKRERERQEEADRQFARQLEKQLEAEEAGKGTGKPGLETPTSSRYTPVVTSNPYKHAELSNKERDKKDREKADAEYAKKLAAQFAQINPRALKKSPPIKNRSPIKSHFQSKGVKRARVSSSDSSGSSDNLYFPAKHRNPKPPLEESGSDTDGTPSPTSLYDSVRVYLLFWVG